MRTPTCPRACSRRLRAFAALRLRCLLVLLFVTLQLCALGCGNDNVELCEEFKRRMGSTNCFGASGNTGTERVSCSTYVNSPCDLRPYFNCLLQHFRCIRDVGGFVTPDTSRWKAECTDKILVNCTE